MILILLRLRDVLSVVGRLHDIKFTLLRKLSWSHGFTLATGITNGLFSCSNLIVDLGSDFNDRAVVQLAPLGRAILARALLLLSFFTLSRGRNLVEGSLLG